MNELERTFLAKFIPEGLGSCKSKEIIDIYFPKSNEHPKIRIRKNGSMYEITKKEPLKEGDASHQVEQTIILSREEFKELMGIDGKKIHKIRYFYPHNGKAAEIDVFKDKLEGLVLVDFEFESVEEKNSFEMPDFCLVDVTQEKFAAGGMLCGKSYKDIENELNKLGYRKISL